MTRNDEQAGAYDLGATGRVVPWLTEAEAVFVCDGVAHASRGMKLCGVRTVKSSGTFGAGTTRRWRLAQMADTVALLLRVREA